MKKLLLGLLLVPISFSFAESSGKSSSTNMKFKNLKEELTSFLEAPAVKQYVLSPESKVKYDVLEFAIKCASGTATASLEIDDVNITGCSSVAVSSTLADVTCTAANSLAVGSKLELNVSANSSCVDMAVGILLRR